MHFVAGNYGQELYGQACGGDRGALYGVFAFLGGMGACLSAVLASCGSYGRRRGAPFAVAAACGALDALAALFATRHEPWLFVGTVVLRKGVFGFGFAAACAGIAAAVTRATALAYERAADAVAPPEADGGRVGNPLRVDDIDGDVVFEQRADRPEPPPARCALVYSANATAALVLVAVLQWVLAARGAGAPAYFCVVAATQAAFASVSLCVVRYILSTCVRSTYKSVLVYTINNFRTPSSPPPRPAAPQRRAGSSPATGRRS